MNEIPSVGGAKGIFEIFIPGAFLLLNIACAVYVWSSAGSDTRLFIAGIVSQPIASLAVLVCFGYLLGVVLRLLKTSTPDKWSGYFLWLRAKIKGQNSDACLEKFPYFKYIEGMAKHKLPEDARSFYNQYWGKESGGENREFFNYCKTIVNALDARSGAEIYAAEALIRYVASMFFALLVSFILMTVTAIVTATLSFLILAFAYSVAIAVILRHLRFLRVKEVETLFAATLLNYATDKWPKIVEE